MRMIQVCLSPVKDMHAICFKGIFRSLFMIKIENNMFYGLTVGASAALYIYPYQTRRFIHYNVV